MNNGRECEEKKGLLSCPATKEVVEEEFKEMLQGGESGLKLSENKNNSPQVDMGAVQQSGEFWELQTIPSKQCEFCHYFLD